MYTSSADADDLPFCADAYSCESGTCTPEQDGVPCIGFEEAADLATQPGSGVFKVSTRSEPATYGAVNASAQNANAICKSDTCYVKGDGQVSLAGYGHQSVFFGWSGCVESPDAHVVLGPLTASSECVARFAPGLIVVDTQVVGRTDGAKVQISGSCSGEAHCSFLNGGSVTLSAPPSTSLYTFTGWSGCATSSEPTLAFTNVRDVLPECIAQYAQVPAL